MASFMKDITLVSQSAALYRDEILKALNVSGYQAKYLLAADGEEGISQDGLAKKLFVNKSNVARQVGALEAAGYLRREQSDSDRRVMRVFVTEKGKEVVPLVREANRRWREIVCNGLTEEEQEELARLVRVMVENAKKYMEKNDESDA